MLSFSEFQVPLLVFSSLLGLAVSLVIYHRSATRSTPLRGPKGSWLFGLAREILATDEHALMFENFATQFGSIFQIPGLLGSVDVVVCDPRAVAHILSKDTYSYQQTPATRFIMQRFVDSSFIAQQRKVLSSAFSNAAIRDQLPVFLDSAYKVKTAWDQALQSDDSVVIDVQQWMSRVSLDSIGIAGFSHDFESLSGRTSQVADAFGAFGSSTRAFLVDISLILSPIFPWLLELPGRRKTILKNLSVMFSQIAEDLVKKAKNEMEHDISSMNSIMSTLSMGAFNIIISPLSSFVVSLAVKSEAASRMSSDEVMDQYLLVAAGYETTAASLTWALIELARNQEAQNSLRAEVYQVLEGEPSWDHLTNSLPFLDAVICESLRLHPISREIVREAQENDTIPLSEPLTQADGHTVDSIFVARGTHVRVQNASLNQSVAFWGEDAKDFRPTRWLDGNIVQQRAAEIQGHKHILTFSDGPRTCLGKTFAITQLKVRLCVCKQ
ncbi:hypothetical protein C0991_010334 [Blastosporella zonata]|nr:hypothetical protein C0991_010334 [Blastosporella zonata]